MLDKLQHAFERLHTDKSSYKEIFDKMLPYLSQIEFTGVTADTDSGSGDDSLEIIGVLPSGLMLSVEKPYSTIDDNKVLCTIIYNKDVLLITIISMDVLPEKIEAIEDKLKETI